MKAARYSTADYTATSSPDTDIPQVPRGHRVERVRRPGGGWHIRVLPKRASAAHRSSPPTPAPSRAEPSARPFVADLLADLPAPSRFPHRYRWVRADDITNVRPALRQAIELEVRSSRYKLGYTPRVRFFVPAGTGASFSWRRELLGISWPRQGQVGLRADLPVAEALRIWAHELNHLLGGDERTAREAERTAIPVVR